MDEHQMEAIERFKEHYIDFLARVRLEEPNVYSYALDQDAIRKCTDWRDEYVRRCYERMQKPHKPEADAEVDTSRCFAALTMVCNALRSLPTHERIRTLRTASVMFGDRSE